MMIAGVPFKIEGLDEIQCDNCSVGISSAVFLSVAIFVLYSSMKKRENKRSVLLWLSMCGALMVLSAEGLKMSKDR